jgi:chaperonin GroEL (HSP60 family)
MYHKLKAENAFSSAQNALKSGVVKGGGLALKEIGETVDNILSKAIQAPYNQIQDNSGGIIKIDDSVIDPLSVTISALQSACSLAGMLITTEVAVAFKNKENEK